MYSPSTVPGRPRSPPHLNPPFSAQPLSPADLAQQLTIEGKMGHTGGGGGGGGAPLKPPRPEDNNMGRVAAEAAHQPAKTAELTTRPPRSHAKSR